jgi:hypothetical protein
MKTNKLGKIIILLTAITCCFALLAACGGKDGDNGNNGNNGINIDDVTVGENPQLPAYFAETPESDVALVETLKAAGYTEATASETGIVMGGTRSENDKSFVFVAINKVTANEQSVIPYVIMAKAAESLFEKYAALYATNTEELKEALAKEGDTNLQINENSMTVANVEGGGYSLALLGDWIFWELYTPHQNNEGN